MTWSGARVFDGRAPEPMYLVGGAVLWILVCRTPFFVDSIDAKVLLTSGIITAYTWATAYEFWRGRSEPLVSRWPAIFMLFAHGALFLLRTPLVAGAAVVADQPGVRQRVADGAELRGAAVHHRDRLHPAGHGEGAHRAAPQDRGAGRSAHRHRQPPRLPRGGHRAEQAAGDAKAAPAAVLLADLDHFKSINDRFGHAVGDHVLQIFAEAASAKLGPFDLIGRLGGEEFAIVLYDAGRDKGLAIAERIRLAFETAAADVDGRPIGGTVSMGMAIAETNLFDIPTLLAQADEALYCAKERGRNRIEVASLQLVLDRAQEAEQRRAGAAPTGAGAAAPSAA